MTSPVTQAQLAGKLPSGVTVNATPTNFLGSIATNPGPESGTNAAGLGTISFTFSDSGSHTVTAWFDYSFGDSWGFESASAHGGVPLGFGYGIDPTGWTDGHPGPMYAAVQTNGSLTDDGADGAAMGDITLALRMTLQPDAGNVAKFSFTAADSDPGGAFYLQQTNMFKGDSDPDLYLSGAVTQEVPSPMAPPSRKRPSHGTYTSAWLNGAPEDVPPTRTTVLLFGSATPEVDTLTGATTTQQVTSTSVNLSPVINGDPYRVTVTPNNGPASNTVSVTPQGL